MNPEHERAAFERAIDENPLDASNHLVYADWLREQGEHDEGDFRQAMGEWLGREQDRFNPKHPIVRRNNMPAGISDDDIETRGVNDLTAEPHRGAVWLTQPEVIGWRTYRGFEDGMRRAFMAGRRNTHRLSRPRFQVRRYNR